MRLFFFSDSWDWRRKAKAKAKKKKNLPIARSDQFELSCTFSPVYIASLAIACCQSRREFPPTETWKLFWMQKSIVPKPTVLIPFPIVDSFYTCNVSAVQDYTSSWRLPSGCPTLHAKVSLQLLLLIHDLINGIHRRRYIIRESPKWFEGSITLNIIQTWVIGHILLFLTSCLLL